jgi:uncharacterized protein YeaO (DUF488 family)
VEVVSEMVKKQRLINVKRIYEGYQPSDGYRVLVDRLWPRGVSKEKAHLDLWLKEIAPSDVLRKWFHHESGQWVDFRNRYLEELEEHPDEVLLLIGKMKESTITLLYSAKDTEHNQALILKEFLENQH